MAQKNKEKPIGKRLKDIRTDKGLSLDYIANETGFSIDYISGIEKGTIMPPVATILQLSRALEIDSGVLLKKERDEADKKKIEGF